MVLVSELGLKLKGVGEELDISICISNLLRKLSSLFVQYGSHGHLPYIQQI